MDAITHSSTDSKKEADRGTFLRQWGRENGFEFGDDPMDFADIRGWDKEAPPPRGWAVRDRIPLGQVTLFSGEGGISKTQAALQLACACVLGYDWFGVLPVQQGPAIYLGCEDDEAELRRRLHSIIEYPDHPFSSFEELARRGLHVASYAGRNMALAQFDGDGDLVYTALYERLWNEAQKIRPKVIVLDPLSDIFPGNENDRSQVTAFMGLLRNLAIVSGAAVIVNSHPSLSGTNSGTGLSGSTAWHGKVRARLYLRADPENPGARILEFKKNQYAPLGESVRLRLNDDGVLFPEAQGESPDPKIVEERAEQVFLDLLDRYADGGRSVTDKPGTSYAPAKFAEESEAKSGRFNRKTMGAAMVRLFSTGQIRVVTEGPPSKKRSRIVRA